MLYQPQTAVANGPEPFPRPASTSFAAMLNAASLAFLQHGDLPNMAVSLLQAATDLLETDGGLIYDLTDNKEPRLLAACGNVWHCDLTPSPLVPNNWIDGFPQQCWRLPVDRGEPLLLSPDREDFQQLRRAFPTSVQSMLALPLQTDGSAIGALFLFNRRHGFSAEICGEIEAIGHTIALGIAAARDRLARQQAENELRQAQKMEALGQLAAGVAHDFNNMLTVINGYTSLVRKNLPENTSAHQDLGIVLDAGRKAAELSRQLLAFSRRQMLQPQVLDLNSRIDNLQKMLRRLIREDITFEIELADSLPYIKADPGQLEQILMNLVINARDAMPTGGRIIIRSGCREFDRSFTRLHPGSKNGHYVWFSIRDTGNGISLEDQKKIFQPFFTTKEKGKGTGLGLATVYGIVKQSGGYITVESAPNQGSCFTIYLPRTDDGPEVDLPATATPNLCRMGKLLLVEDDPEVLKFATKALLESGFQVIPAGDVELAQELFDHHHSEISLLVTDMVMPTLSGPLLARNLRRLQPDLQVLFLSGYGQVTFSSDFLSGQTGAFLAKPFTGEGLVGKVQEVLSEGSLRLNQ